VVDNHRHHIIPKHEWKERFGNLNGVNEADNIIFLSTTQHALAHRWLWESYGKLEDKIAWLALLGQIGKEEIISQISRLQGMKSKGIPKSAETRRKISQALKGIPKSTVHKKRSMLIQSDPLVKEKQRMARTLFWSKQPKVTCPICGISSKTNMKRYHFDNCKKGR